MAVHKVLVKHWKHGELVVEAGSRTEAYLKAAVQWGQPFTDIVSTAKLGLLREDLEQLRAEGQAQGTRH